MRGEIISEKTWVANNHPLLAFPKMCKIDHREVMRILINDKKKLKGANGRLHSIV